MNHHKNTAHKKGFERKKLANGQPNPRYVDLLLEDKPIAGQHWACMSFVTPTKILKKTEIFFFEQFLKKWELNKSMEKFIQFLNFVSYKYNLSFDNLTEDFKEFVKEEQSNLHKTQFLDEYKTFLDNNEEELQKQFDIEHNFQTNVAGVKIRGSYSTIEEAKLRCKLLEENDPDHDIHVCPVGVWASWDPEAYKTGEVIYMEEELNQLMHEKKKNEEQTKREFDERVKETKQKAMEENIKNAEKSGNVLSQTIDENGNLVGINNVNTQETMLKEQSNVSLSTICNQLFEGDNIVVGKTDNGQSQLKSGPFATQVENKPE
jgi:hypothetical protein